MSLAYVSTTSWGHLGSLLEALKPNDILPKVELAGVLLKQDRKDALPPGTASWSLSRVASYKLSSTYLPCASPLFRGPSISPLQVIYGGTSSQYLHHLRISGKAAATPKANCTHVKRPRSA